MPCHLRLPVVASLLLLGAALFPAWAAAATANVALTNASARLSQTSDTAWTLDKTGGLDTATSTVTWQVTATEGATVSGHLRVNGVITVTNAGGAGATIGNIVVNLQARSGKRWVTRAADVADATLDDDATSAQIVAAASSEGLWTITENAASGRLLFMDASNNSVFALAPQRTIAPGASVSLLFSAAFDNNLLALPVGTLVRAEVIVSFGNAGSKGPSAALVDINGNAAIDADEARVRSVPARLTLTVPAAVDGNGAVTLTDTISDISTSGDVTFSNPTFNLGATGGTVTANVSGGTNGGSITNCAHLTSADQTVTSGGFTFPLTAGLNLQDCATVNVDGTPTCTSGTAGCGWQPGDLVTFDQGQWGTVGTTAAGILNSSFGSFYFPAPANGTLEVGIAGAGGFSIRFSNAGAVLNFLPASGTAGALTADTSNPTTTTAGILGGEITALAINVDFSSGALLGGSVTTDFGDLTICGVTGVPTMTVGTFLALAENTLGGGNNGYSPAAIRPVAQDLNSAFRDGTPSTFAQNHLVIGACP